MSCRNRRIPRAQVVLLVGGDDEVAKSCARLMSPLPVRRARHLSLASRHLETLRPAVVVIAPTFPAEDAKTLEALASEASTSVVRLLDHVGSRDQDETDVMIPQSESGVRRRVSSTRW